MALDAGKLFVPGDGHVSVAPTGSTAPTNATTALAAAFVELGYTTEDGIAATPSTDTQVIRGWQSIYALRYTVTGRDLKIVTGLMEVNQDTFGVWSGGGVTTGGPTAWTVSPPAAGLVDSRSWVFEGTDGAKKYRLYLASALVIDSGEWKWTKQGAAVLPITVGLTATGTGAAWTLYVSDAAFSTT